MKWLAGEYAICIALASWGDLSGKGNPDGIRYWPWPASIVKVSVAFALLAVLGLVSEPLAGTMGAGLILAQILKRPVYKSGADAGKFVLGSGVPSPTKYYVLRLGGTASGSNPATSSAPTTGGTAGPPVVNA